MWVWSATARPAGNSICEPCPVGRVVRIEVEGVVDQVDGKAEPVCTLVRIELVTDDCLGEAVDLDSAELPSHEGDGAQRPDAHLVELVALVRPSHLG